MKNVFILFVSLLILSVPAFSSDNEICMSCHEDPDLKTEEEKFLFIDLDKFNSSIHGEAGFSCTDCHLDLQEFEDFPHPEKLSEVHCEECHSEAAEDFSKSIHGQATPDKDCCFVSCQDCHGTHDIKRTDNIESRVYSLNLPQTCERCHLERVQTERGSEFIKQYEKSIHYEGLEKLGLTTSSNCSNCHGAHDIRSVHDLDSRVSRKNIIRTCAKCHVGIERDYLEGVHGEEYEKGSLDVPVCTDCHNEHDITSPQDLGSGVYATKVAEVCSSCHDDEILSRQYGFLTSRAKTYIQSFHGTASSFGEARVANCASCHGFHGVRPSSDPKSSIHPDNLPKTCGSCHPGAGKHFAEGKIHIISEKETNKWSYFVKKFYIILISAIVSVFLIFITTDLLHRLTHKRGKVE